MEQQNKNIYENTYFKVKIYSKYPSGETNKNEYKVITIPFNEKIFTESVDNNRKFIHLGESIQINQDARLYIENMYFTNNPDYSNRFSTAYLYFKEYDYFEKEQIEFYYRGEEVFTRDDPDGIKSRKITQTILKMAKEINDLQNDLKTLSNIFELNIDKNKVNEISSLEENIKNPEYFQKLSNKFSYQMKDMLRNTLNQLHNNFNSLPENNIEIENYLLIITNFSSMMIQLAHNKNLKNIFNQNNPEFVKINEIIPEILAELTWQQFSRSVNPNVEKGPNYSISLNDYSRAEELQ
jgi:hypothetical protein